MIQPNGVHDNLRRKTEASVGILGMTHRRTFSHLQPHRQADNTRGGSLDDYAFPSRTNHLRHIGTRQYARLVDEWVAGIGLRPEDYGTHSLRRTKASIIYKATGNLRAVQLLLGHAKIEGTVRYLGVDVEDALSLSEHTEV